MDSIQTNFPQLTQAQKAQLSALGGLYTEWNDKINIISRKDIQNLYTNHILHSLAIAKYIQFIHGSTVLDAGTGGGFPGLPLAILFPNVQFHLVDSVGKKLYVVQDIANHIGVTNIQTHHMRLESFEIPVDFVVSRAVTRLDTMWEWVHKNIKEQQRHDIQNGLLYLKGGDIHTELPNNCSVQKIPLIELINEPQFIDKALVYIHL